MSQVIDLSQERLIRSVLSTAMAGTGKDGADLEEKVAELKAVIAQTDDATLEDFTGVSQTEVTLGEILQSAANVGSVLREAASLVKRLRNR
jgi:hypothetical protein